MWRDPIVDEVRRYRAEYASRFDQDMETMFRDLEEKQAQAGRKVVSLPPRPPARGVRPSDAA